MKHKLTLKEIQHYELDMLKVLVDVCERHGLRYFLAGGTLLGAVRHKGFIPWDDDIDILMPRPDYDQLLEYGSEIAASGPYKLASYEMGNLNYPFAKIYDLRTTIHKKYDDDDQERNLWIDIFPMDGLPDSDAEVASIYRKCMTARRLLRLKGARLGEGKTAFRKNMKPFLKIMLIPLSNSMLLHYIDKLSRTYSVDECNYIGGICNGYGPQEKMPKIPYLKHVMMQFEDMEVRAPGCWDYYLTRLYGDYMVLPPENKRIDHSMDIWIDEQTEDLHE